MESKATTEADAVYNGAVMRRNALVVLAAALTGGLLIAWLTGSFAPRASRNKSQAVDPALNAVNKEEKPTQRVAVLVRGRCVDGASGEPAPDARIGLGNASAASDHSGGFELAWPASFDRTTLTVSCDGFRVVSVALKRPRTTLDLGELALLPARTLSGLVLLPDGEPAANAEWQLVDRQDRIVRSGDADERGRFSISLTSAHEAAMWVPSARFRVHAMAAGYGPGQASASADPLVVRLTSCVSLTGRVVAHASGIPIAAAELRLAAPSRSNVNSGWVVGRTGDDGTFKVVGPASGWSLVVRKNGYAPRTYAGEIESPLQIELEAAGRLAGVVMGPGPDQRPAAGAMIHVNYPYRGGPLRAWQTLRPVAVADGQGRFEILNVLADRAFRIDALKAGMSGPVTFEKLPGESIVLKLKIPEWSVLCKARVVDRFGSPVPGASVWPTLWGAGIPAETDADGVAWFVLDRSISRPTAVIAEASGRYAVEPEVWVADWSTRDAIELMVKRGGIASGRVVMPVGAGPALVSGWHVGATQEPVFLATARPVSGGTFAVPVLPGDAAISVEAEGASPTVKHFHAADRVHYVGEIAVSSAVPLQGIVVVGGKPAEGIQVECAPEPALRPYLRFTQLRARTDDAGRFSFPSVPEGQLRIIARRSRKNGGGSAETTVRRGGGAVRLEIVP